jgi:CO/xanthine dehydrogenase FAD-binding subunit
MIPYDYYRPHSLDEAFQIKKTIPGSLYISGGTDLMVRIKKQEIHPPALISLLSISDICGIKENGFTQIGAMTTISDVLKNKELRKKYPVLLEAAHSLGSVQIRNAATIGGNLCNGSPAADMAPALLVLEAKVRLQSEKKRRDISLPDFFQGPGRTCLASEEIMTDILLYPPESNTKSIFLKKGRVKIDLAVASVAALLKTDGDKCLWARLAAGSVAPVPVRLQAVESLLEGATISPKLLLEVQQVAAKSVSPISDIRASEKYRRCLTGVLVKRALESLMGWSGT